MKGEHFTKNTDKEHCKAEQKYEPKYTRRQNGSLGHKINKFLDEGEKARKKDGRTAIVVEV